MFSTTAGETLTFIMLYLQIFQIVLFCDTLNCWNCIVSMVDENEAMVEYEVMGQN